MPFLELRDVSHCFSSFCAIRDVTIDFEVGEFVVLAGPNGSGKTVLVRHLNGLLAPTKGTVRLDGKPMAKMLSRAKQLVGMVFQEPEHQIIGQTVAEDIAFGPRNLGSPSNAVQQTVNQALDLMRLTNKQHEDPRTLSGGEKRRLAIAGALAMHPRIIVCDEPFSNLDYAGVIEVLSALTTLHESGCGVIVVTHEIEKVLAHATRLVVLHNGEIAYDGDAAPAIPQFAAWGLRPPVRQSLAGDESERADALVPSLSWLNGHGCSMSPACGADGETEESR